MNRKLACFAVALVTALALAGRRSALRAASSEMTFANGKTSTAARNPLVTRITVLQQEGSRPRFSPDGQLIVFDRKGAGGYYHVLLMTRAGQVLRSLTEEKPGIPHRNSGNAVFHPSGRFIVFLAEEQRHFLALFHSTGDPGVGLFSNLWATNVEGTQFWKLTDIPIKRRMRDGIPVYAEVNPLFSPDGRRLLWTERYSEGPTRWGLWRIKAADFLIRGGIPSLAGERVLYQPTRGNYVTAMGFLSDNELIMSGNLDGQPEYGMDVYRYNLSSGALLNLTRTPEYWEEDANTTPGGHVIYMSNRDSKYKFNFQDQNWAKQAITREYYLTGADGRNTQRLTYFNEPSAPEYAGKRILTVASDISRDGRCLAGTVGVDEGTGAKRADVQLKIVLLEFARSL